MVGVLMTGLRRFHELTHDVRVAEAIVGGAQWLIDKTYVPEAGLFRYTSCPKRAGPSVGHTVVLVEALTEAYMFAQDPRLAEILYHSLVCLGSSDEPRYGRNLFIEARYIPTMLYILKEFPISTGE